MQNSFAYRNIIIGQIINLVGNQIKMACAIWLLGFDIFSLDFGFLCGFILFSFVVLFLLLDER